MPGMDCVDSLAEYLVGLWNHTGLTLNNQQVSNIISLWQNLLPYDQQRVVFAARHQDRLITGKFRSPKKKAEFTPVWRAQSGVCWDPLPPLPSGQTAAAWGKPCLLDSAVCTRVPKSKDKGP